MYVHTNSLIVTLKLCTCVHANLCKYLPRNLAALKLLHHQMGLEIKSHHGKKYYQCLKYGGITTQWVLTNENWAVMIVVTYNMNGVNLLTKLT